MDPVLHVVVFWRRDVSRIKYEWLDDKWEQNVDLNNTVQKLDNTIGRLLHTNEALTYEAVVQDLFDEHAKGIFGRIITKVGNFVGSMYDDLNKDQILPALSVVGTFVFIIGVGYFMAYLV